MEFGLPNCGMLIMKRGKVVKNEGRSMPDVRTMNTNVLKVWMPMVQNMKK